MKTSTVRPCAALWWGGRSSITRLRSRYIAQSARRRCNLAGETDQRDAKGHMEPQKVRALCRHHADHQLKSGRDRKRQQRQCKCQSAWDAPEGNKSDEAGGKCRRDHYTRRHRMRRTRPTDARQQCAGKDGLREKGDQYRRCNAPPPLAHPRVCWPIQYRDGARFIRHASAPSFARAPQRAPSRRALKAAGSNSSITLPEGSCSRICFPRGPSKISLRNGAPALRSRETSFSILATIR